MKKIITINLSGRVLQIEEPAYEQLQQYVASLRNYFSKEESREEIINDIEARIAEQFYSFLQKGEPCITETHLQEVIAAMGKPEEIAGEELVNENSSAGPSMGQSKNTIAPESKRDFFRDANNRVLGGVASGIANYVGIDPVIIRVLFVLLSFSSFGIVSLVYIILWILFPAKEVESYGGRRFYRNPDDRVLGGVASGIAAYLKVSPRNIRLIFLAPLLLQILFSILNIFDDSALAEMIFNLSFGSLVGFSILLYIVLWIILPKAETTYQKMEMRGEPINLERIRQHVSEGSLIIKEKMEAWGKDVELTAKQLSEKAEELAKEVKQPGKNFFRSIGKFIKLLFKIFFFLFFGGLAFVILIALVAILFVGVVSWPLQHYIWSSDYQQGLAWATVGLFLLVPVVGFIIWMIRRLINTKAGHAYLAWTFGTLWALGWVSATLFVSSITKDFSYQEKIVDTVSLPVAPAQKMVVRVSEPELEYSGSYSWIEGDSRGWDVTSDTLKLSNVIIKIEPSNDTTYQVQLVRYANGRTEEEAAKRASAIDYHLFGDAVIANKSAISKNKSGDTLEHTIKNLSHLQLNLGSGYSIPASSKYRAQRIRVIIKVPVGGRISFDESVREKLSDVELLVRRKYNNKFDIEWTDTNIRYRSNIEYTMGADGQLKAEDGSSVFFEDVIIEETKEVPEPPPAPSAIRERASLAPDYFPAHKKLQGWGPSPLRLLLG